MPMRWALGVFCGLAALGCGGAGPSGAAQDVLYFTAIPDQNTTELAEKYAPVARYLSAKLGVTVRYRPAADYGASVEMFKNGDVHLAWFGGLTGCQARAAVNGARAIAQGAEDPKFVSYFIAHRSTGLTESKDFPTNIADLTFAFGSEKSTSGRLMPEFHIRKHTNKSPREFFRKTPQFSGSHDKTIELVAAGTVQAGVVNYRVYEKRVARDISRDDAVIVWRTPPYADYNWTAHPGLEKNFGPGFIDRLQTVLVGITDPDILAAFQRSSLIKASNKDFEGIARVARNLNLLR